jgi:hypothetical protein
MKQIFLLLILSIFHQLSAQFTDNFSDGNFSSNPTWTGETDKFIVNGLNQLQLFAPAVTDDAYLSTESAAIENASWEFFVRLNFNPSSTNYARVYLVSDNENLKGALNGYFVYIGGTADKISLFRQSGTVRTEIITGTSGSVNVTNVQVKIRVMRDDIGNWTLERDTALTNEFVTEGSVFDNTHFQSSYFGVYCDYTQTRSQHFFYDDIVVTGNPYIDTEAPVFQELSILSENQLLLQFNENLGVSSANILNFSVNNGVGNPEFAEINPLNNSQIILTFEDNFVDNTNYVLGVSNISDLTGNIMTNFTEPFYYFVFSIPVFGEIRINEIMADETPSIGMPLTEYVELFNTTNKTFNLQGYRICNDNACGTIQSSILPPNGYLIITPTSGLPLFTDFGINAINATSFPGLKNAGDEVSLKNPTLTTTLDMMTYTTASYQDPSKSNGGYSLELINPFSPCLGNDNWRATNSVVGGTPGAINSVFNDSPDVTPPIVISSFLISPNTLQIKFNELIENIELMNLNFTTNTQNEIANIVVNGSYSNQVNLVFEDNFLPNVIYTYNIANLNDCEGNTANLSGTFVLTSLAEIGDIVINEILFNPVTGGSDYVELYNNSEKFINLKDWNMANLSNGNPANFRIIASQNLIFEPHTYLALTVDSVQVKQTYVNHGVGRFVYCNLPTYANANGNVLLMDPNSAVIDSVSYLEKWHFTLISDKKGKSLERINPNGPSNSPSNWQTASENSGWGTPGMQNSQYLNPQAQGQFSVEPTVISPDNDGFEDFAIFTYALPEPAMVGTIRIFDENGRPVRELVNNYFFDQSGELKWDGLDDNGTKCRVGRYLILFEVYSTQTGTTLVFKQVVVVSTKL